MLNKSLILMAMLGLSACANRMQVPAEPAPGQAEVIEPGEVAVVEAFPVEPEPAVPDACEALLRSLEETRPVLEQLDESLASQSRRFERAVDRLEQPVPESRPLDCPSDVSNPLGTKEIIGAMEWLYIDPPGRHFRARADSGTGTSSLSVGDVVEFERDGDDWVRFTFQHGDDDEPVEFQLPIKRTVLVRRASAQEAERRYVIELDIRLGDQLQTAEFTLTDRGRTAYPILLGRAFLRDLYVIDVSQSYTQERFDAS